MAIHSDMQGPAPSGFHVPTKDEWVDLCGILTSTFSMASNATTMGTYLKMPMSGYRDNGSSNVRYVGSSGFYCSSTAYSASNAYYLGFNLSNISPLNFNYYAYGYSVRCFKDSPVVPTSSWTTLYDGSSVATDAGVFYNATDGLISVSGDGVTWHTIQDKNLGATTVYNQGDTETDANCGYFYQWGNNYGFPHSGTVTTSSTKVDASNYGPGNYYSSSTFITVSVSPYNWSSVQNDNLWGGVSQGTRYDPMKLHGYIGTWHMEWVPESYDYSAMQGPAPDGFHVPLKQEWIDIINILRTTFGLSQTASTMGIYLKMPVAGWRKQDSTPNMQGADGYYWSSIENSAAYGEALRFLANGTIFSVGYMSKTCGFPVRCLKDYPVIPNSNWTTLYDGSSVATGAGVFLNTSLGLISLSGDGNTRYTIQDKNLGATTVYNNGDSLSEANCGKYYQWGNNYGFPRTGSVTTSSTRVDATGYGPGNYYNSGTFITGYNPWDTQHNANLRGGETGIIIIPGHYRPRQPVVLKTYEEIVAMATAEGAPRTNTIAMLNDGHGQEYYDILNEGNHLTRDVEKMYFSYAPYITGIENGYYRIRYKNGERFYARID